MAEAQEERTEEATQTRRDEFRKKGQIAQTRELGTGVLLLVAAGCIYGFSRFFLTELFELFQSSFGENLVAAIRQGDLARAGASAAEKLVWLLLPTLGIASVASVGSSLIQVGFVQVEDALTFNFERLNPIEGFKKMWGLHNIVESLKAAVKISLISFIAYMVLKNDLSRLPYLTQMNVAEIGGLLARLCARLCGSIGTFILALALGDYFFQRWELEKRMMMTKQEIREENRSREGDPLIKARIRKIQRDVANRRMMQKVPEADVIVTNPTHIAVALKYNDGLAAPQLIAKGADLIAEKIKSIAAEHSIPIIENKPLARTIYKTMKIGQLIPKELYVAVAEVLSYVYKLKRRFRGVR